MNDMYGIDADGYMTQSRWRWMVYIEPFPRVQEPRAIRRNPVGIQI